MRWKPVARSATLSAVLAASTFVAVPAIAFAQAPKPVVVQEHVVQTQSETQPCVVANVKAQCYRVTTFRTSAHVLFPSGGSFLTSLAGVAGACGQYQVYQSVTRYDYAAVPFPPYELLGLVTSLSASGGYNGCGGSWTNWLTPTCSVKLAGFDCVGYTGTCGPCGGNYHDPSHSYWNLEWYNQPERLYAAGVIAESWTVYLRLWNDGYGHTASWAGAS